MAPFLKELEAPVATNAPTAPGAPQAKSPSEATSRPQPVALEIPVTINGARTIEGSDKREPFSEASHTVLVFPLGAVVRLATPLFPGQLIFLTNEKTKKEIVCQVVKSKSGGNTSGYVELQFTEPAAGFWGLLLPGTSAAPSAPRPVAPAASVPPKVAPPALPVAPKPVPAKPVAAVPSFLAPVPPTVAPPPPPPLKLEPAISASLAPPSPVQEQTALRTPPSAVSAQAQHPHSATPVPAAPEIPKVHGSPEPPSVSSQPVGQVIPPSVRAVPPVFPAPAVHDYSREIGALFAVPQAPTAPPTAPISHEPKVEPAVSAAASTDGLKLQAAHLQAQLSSLHFAEPHTTPAPAPAAPPVTQQAAPHIADVAKKVLEIAVEEPLPFLKGEPRPASAVRQPAALSLAANEEVQVPAWLALMSRNSEPAVADPVPPREVAAVPATDAQMSSEESQGTLSTGEDHRPHPAVFGGQFLAESSAPAGENPAPSSKTGLFLALAATILLGVGGGAWYFRQSLFGTLTAPAAARVSTNSPFVSSPTADAPAAAPVSALSGNPVNPASAASLPAASQSSKNASPVPTKAVFTPAPELKASSPAPRNAAPPEPPKKSAFGNVKFAAPVVNRAGDSQQIGDTLPAIDTNAASSAGDPLAAVNVGHRKEPAAPLPVGGDVKPARLLKSIPPLYPTIAKTQRISGNVQIDALIDESGNVAAVKVVSGPTILHRAALEAVRQWKYTPALLNDRPTAMHLTVTVQFRTQ